ncbi:MAG: hypothetical protein K2Q20_13225, partial [Phycisphaerales bacterium]|nr:hypothetical protein [Phycisphaerales bacterium]
MASRTSNPLVGGIDLASLTFTQTRHIRHLHPGDRPMGRPEDCRPFFNFDCSSGKPDGVAVTANGVVVDAKPNGRWQVAGTGSWGYTWRSNARPVAPMFTVELTITSCPNIGTGSTYGSVAAAYVKDETNRIEAHYNFRNDTFSLREYVGGVVRNEMIFATTATNYGWNTRTGKLFLVIGGNTASLWVEGGLLTRPTYIGTMNFSTNFRPKLVATNAEYYVGWTAAADGANGTVVVGGLRAYYGGAVGYRELRNAFWDDGSPVEIGGLYLMVWDNVGSIPAINGWPDARQADPTHGVYGLYDPTIDEFRELGKFMVKAGGRVYAAQEMGLMIERATGAAHVYWNQWGDGDLGSYPSDGLPLLHEVYNGNIFAGGVIQLNNPNRVTLPPAFTTAGVPWTVYDPTVWYEGGRWWMSVTCGDTQKLTDAGHKATVGVFSGSAPDVFDTFHARANISGTNDDQGEGARTVIVNGQRYHSIAVGRSSSPSPGKT